nr:aminoacyl-tRNA synthetase, class 1a, anticodon-binding [Tanacetum cinerariifolium]
MDNLGYVTEGKLTFFKNKFSPQWRFLVHTLLHCLSTKSGSWDQFGSPIAIALICLSDGRRFNWSNYIFRGMVSNIENARKFLMYPRFLQTILAIKTRFARQYKVLVFSSKLFANMRLNFARNPMPLLPAMLLQAQAAHLPTPSRLHTSDPVAPVLEQGHSFDPHETTAGPFLTMVDAPIGGDFPTSPSRSSPAPPTGQPSGSEEDPITLTTLSSVVSTLMQKVHSLEMELHDHKKLFKDVVGKLVKKVKTLGVKLKTQKRKLVVSDSDQEDGDAPHVDLDALRALANAAVAVNSDIPSGSTSQIPTASSCAPTAVPLGAFDVASYTYVVPAAPLYVAPGASDVPSYTSVVPAAILTVPASSPTVLAAVTSSGIPTGVSSKGKSPMVKEDIPFSARTSKGAQQDVLDSAMFYNKADWLNIRAQVEANASLSKNLQGDDVCKDNFPARMAALIKKKRQALAEQLFKKRQNRPMTQAQQKAYMRQYIRKVQSHSQIQAFGHTLKRPEPVLDEPSSKWPKSPKASTPSMLEESDDEVTLAWSAVVGWEVLPTPLGEINALYRIDGSTKHFTTLCQILHMVDRQDLVKLYGLVVQYYETHPTAGAGLILWGDLQVLFDSHAAGKGSCVWQNQHQWEIRSWRLYTLSNVYVLETVSGEVLSMFTDVSYPLSIKLIERMLMHKLEIDSDIVGNDLPTVEQLIQFIKNQLVTAQASSV